LASDKLEPGQNISLKVDTLKESRVSLMAYDKKLTYLRTGNDLDRGDMINELITLRSRNESLNNNEMFDGTNYILKIDLDDLEECSPEDVEKAEKNYPEIKGRNDGTIVAADAGPANTVDMKARQGLSRTFDKMREDFRDSWLFESDKTDINELVPDSITSWVISAFSMNPTEGFALAERKELIVAKEFFVELTLPYSIRLGEILKVDVIVFNMLESKQPITADLTFYAQDGTAKPEFKFIKFTNPGVSCETQAIAETIQGTNVDVPAKSGKAVSFFIQPLRAGDVSLRINAAVRKQKHTDKIRKLLLVENEGVAQYDLKKFPFDHKSRQETTFDVEFGVENVVDETILAYSVVMGSMMQIDASYRNGML
jgi:CD109 antigen